MNAAYELAKLLKDRENSQPFSIMEGSIIQLPEIKIGVGDKIILTKDMIRSTVNLYAQDADNNYIWLGKRVYIIPWIGSSGRVQRFLIIGGDGIDG